MVWLTGNADVNVDVDVAVGCGNGESMLLVLVSMMSTNACVSGGRHLLGRWRRLGRRWTKWGTSFLRSPLSGPTSSHGPSCTKALPSTSLFPVRVCASASTSPFTDLFCKLRLRGGISACGGVCAPVTGSE